jgi:hypothetical protein
MCKVSEAILVAQLYAVSCFPKLFRKCYVIVFLWFLQHSNIVQLLAIEMLSCPMPGRVSNFLLIHWDHKNVFGLSQ